MIRSTRIPGILSRITSDNVIQTAILVTGDGELLGATSPTFISPEGTKESVEYLGTLVADIAADYGRLGHEYAQLEQQSTKTKRSHLKCLLLELDHGLVAVSACAEVDYLIIGIAAPNAPMGMVKARLEAITDHIQEALAPLAPVTPLTETLYR